MRFINLKLLKEDLTLSQAYNQLTLLDVFYWVNASLDKLSNETVKNC